MIRTRAGRLIAALAVTVAATPAVGIAAAPAAQASCGWETLGNAGQVYADVLGLVGRVHVGQITQEFDTCNKYVRAHFIWDNTFRTTAWNTITSAYVDVLAHTTSYKPAVSWQGSSGAVNVYSPSQTGVLYSVGGFIWDADATVRINYAQGSATDLNQCTAGATEHDYQYGASDNPAYSVEIPDPVAGSYGCYPA